MSNIISMNFKHQVHSKTSESMFRSKGDWLDLNLFLETFGGGGHFNAAGWTMQLSPGDTIEALVLRFLERVKTLKGEDVSLL